MIICPLKPPGFRKSPAFLLPASFPGSRGGSYPGSWGVDFSAAGSLLLHWRFEEGAGDTIGATVGPGGFMDTASWIRGVEGNWAGYLLTNQFTMDSALTFTNITTVAMWVRIDTVTAGQLITPQAAGAHYIESELDAGDLTFSVVNASGRRKVSVPWSSFERFWKHLAVVFDNSTGPGEILVYVDGVLQSPTLVTNTKSTSGTFTSDVLEFGQTPVNVLDGAVDDLRIYDYRLSAATISSLYSAITLGSPLLDQGGKPLFFQDGSSIFLT